MSLADYFPAIGVEETERKMQDHMGDIVRRLRQKLGLTQEELAHELGITVGTVNRWENGRFRPSKLARSTILEFARKHGITLEEGPHPAPEHALPQRLTVN